MNGFDHYQGTVDSWIKSVGSDYFDPLTNACMLSEEVGEVCRLVCREFGQQAYKDGERPQSFSESLADELADVIFVIACIANEQGICLSAALEKNMLKKTLRDKHRYGLASPRAVVRRDV